ncbi:MAG: hypothetical protein UT56_C0001G0034 [Candidatus Levybacteria bacterium GW2011_GWB1_39_7]|nr:MAG: hypothetical protein UT56_C0001G0034 [Candidatus Levybacteria bacterium GW2011_GWB1_39_7]
MIGENAGGDIVHVYWIMGRSANSRNRILVQEGSNLRTNLFDKANAGDTSLIIYNAMRVENNVHIVSNGDQTDTIAEFVRDNPLEGFDQALLTRTYEPDDPNFTPRISGESWVFLTSDKKGLLTQGLDELSIIQRGRDGNPVHRFFRLQRTPGIGHCIHTYSGAETPLPPFLGKPYPVPIGETIDQTADIFWSTLNDENKVAMVVKTIDAKTGEVNYAIRNKLFPSATVSP